MKDAAVPTMIGPDFTYVGLIDLVMQFTNR